MYVKFTKPTTGEPLVINFARVTYFAPYILMSEMGTIISFDDAENTVVVAESFDVVCAYAGLDASTGESTL